VRTVTRQGIAGGDDYGEALKRGQGCLERAQFAHISVAQAAYARRGARRPCAGAGADFVLRDSTTPM
jgi:hypothetical protein